MKRTPKHVRTKSRLWAGAAAGLAVGGLVVGAVANAATGTTPTAVRKASPASTAPPASAALQADFTAAAAEFQVPVSVLLAVSYQETLWESHQGEPSVTGNYNVMGLTSVDPADLNPVTTAEKKADLAGAAGDPAQIAKKNTASAAAASAAEAKQLAQFETVDTTAPALHTLDAAAALIKQPDSTLRGQMKQSVRGGAALLASYEKAAKGSLPTDAGQWYPAVAQFSQGADTATQNQFADGVYGVIATGAARTTGDNQAVALAAEPAVKPQPQTAPGGARGLAAAQTCEAGPASCTFVPAAAGNFDVANRLNAADGDTVRDIVIHTTEGSAASAISTFRTYSPSNPTSTHFVVAATGAVTQLVRTKDVAFQADNKTINAHSIGVEDEGYALKTGSWVSEVEYDASAALVKQLAKLYSIPLDREHILGHDDVPYVTADYVTDQQDDPGPYWDWAHYMSLLGAPAPDGTGMPLVGGTVTIAPDYASNKPVLTGCSGGACVSHPANFVYLRTSPSSSAPLISDALLKSVRMTPGSTSGADVSDKAVYGQSFVVAGVSGDWTAIWYGGQEAWFDNPGGVNTYANGNPAQNLVLPKGSTAIKVYGRAYPEAPAYTTAGVPADVQPLVALPHYSIAPGQAYTTTGGALAGDFYDYDDANCSTAACKVVIGTTQYYEIRYNHRLAYVLASDVQTTMPKAPPTGTLVPVGPTRVLSTVDGTGGVPKARLKPKGTVKLQVTGTPGIPATGVTAVVLQVTAVQPSASGFVTVYPDGRSRPAVSSINFAYAENLAVPNLVVVPVLDGKVDFYNAVGTVDLLADLTGYFTTDTTLGSTFVPTGPTRILDTAGGVGAAKARVQPQGIVKLRVAGTPGVPATGVTAVALNVTAAEPSASGFLTVYPDGPNGPNGPNGRTPPSASTLGFTAGESIPHLVIVPVTDGVVDFADAGGTVDLLADLTGYFTRDGSGGVFHTAGPVRAMDTRTGFGVRTGKLGPGGVVTLQVGGRNGVPLNATAVILNVTAVKPSAAGSVTVYPYGLKTVPAVSSLTFTQGALISNLVIVPVVNGKVTFSNATGTVDLVAGLTGYFTG